MQCIGVKYNVNTDIHKNMVMVKVNNWVFERQFPKNSLDNEEASRNGQEHRNTRNVPCTDNIDNTIA